MATSRTPSKPKTGVKTTSKSAPRKGQPRARASAPEPAVIVTETSPTSAGPEMKKQELLDKVVQRSEIRKKFAKPALEAMLEVLGEALAEGRELNLPPLGKVKFNRIKEGARARIIVAKIRQSKQGGNVLPEDAGTENDIDMKDEVAERAE
ncbi:bacterial DNA-binding protein [Roseovarius sp. A-2]|uniref:HU family DNA-binding protein n=1 Tax=Roseovarius sp. A-2 TaxID=1570360 RepID=UPI0009B58DC8|nr:HU family DNA-binding protein [Roseovarius sp. A-2]GAW34890.1 bacterial DNA-binding protein [Roseovarius sp. A-2]